MYNQEAADTFAEKQKTTMKTNESKTDKTKDLEKIVSLKIRETNFKTPSLVKKEEHTHRSITCSSQKYYKKL